MSKGGHELVDVPMRRWQPMFLPGASLLGISFLGVWLFGGVRRFLDRHRWCGELLLLGALYGVYELVRSVTDSGLSTAYANGRAILHFEQSVHFAPEHALNTFFHNTPAVAIPACFIYATCHYLVTPLVLIWMWRAHKDQYRRVRSVLIVATLVALIGFCLLPTAPPRLIGGFSDTMAQWSSVGWWGTAASVPDGLQGLTDLTGAMPSLHVGWALWCGWAIARCARRRWVKGLGIAYPVITTIVVLGTANHYLADALAGATVIGLGMLAVALIARLQARHTASRLIRSIQPAPVAAADDTHDVARDAAQRAHLLARSCVRRSEQRRNTVTDADW